MIQLSQLSQLSEPFKSVVNNDPVLYALFFDQMKWGDVEDVEKQ
jgi:hypothetical protein